MGGQPIGHVGGGNAGGRVEQAKPDKRAGRPAARMGQRTQPVFQRQPGFVSDETGQFAAGLAGLFRCGKDVGNVVGPMGNEDLARVFEQQGICRTVFARIVEQDKGMPLRHRCQPLPYALRLSRDCLTAPTSLCHITGD